ncbi:MAG: hypothetical protein KBB21_28355 [Nannocystaceae bacterium]|nr:hypothetical protein [Nannocystaceae bacterium]
MTLDELPPGTFAVCPVCYWEDDDAQFRDPNLAGGANEVSLVRARMNFREFGASSAAHAGSVRQPLPAEQPPPSSR